MSFQLTGRAGCAYRVKFEYWKNTLDRRYYSVIASVSSPWNLSGGQLAVVDDFGDLVPVAI